MRRLKVDDEVEFIGGNFQGLTGIVTEVNFHSSDKRAIFGYLHTVQLSNGKVGYIEKAKHYNVINYKKARETNR